MIKSSDLQNRAVVEGPALNGAEEVNEAIRKMKSPRPDPAAELATLRERIDHARTIMAPRGVCCGHCWGMGAEAVRKILDGE